MTTRSLTVLRAICPQCRRNRFIPHAWAPYCTPSCERSADQEAAPAAAGQEDTCDFCGHRYGPGLMKRVYISREWVWECIKCEEQRNDIREP